MLDLGKVRPGSTIRIPFSSFDKDDGSSITLTNFAVGDILIYKDGSTTERASTNGFTATTDFDSKTGKHLAIIDLSDNTTAAFYAAGSEYLVAIDAVTVDGVTVGGWIARFVIGYDGSLFDTSIATLASQTSFTLTSGPAEDDAINGFEVIIHDVASAVQCGRAVVLDYTGASKTVTLAAATTYTVAATDNISIMQPSPLQPTVMGRTLDVSSGGEAGVDWANVGSPTTALNLSGTTVKTATDVETDTQDIQSRLPAALTGDGLMKADAIRWAGALTATDDVALATAPTNFALISIDGNGRVDVIKIAGTTQTARDIGASVLLSNGTGAGQVSLSSGTVTVGTNNDKTGYRLSATGVDDILDEVVEGSYTARQYLKLFAAALLGKLSGAATTTVTVRDTADGVDRIVATVDANGNRSAVTLDAT